MQIAKGYRKVHKMIGYGLTDVQTDGNKLSDPRINADSILLDFDCKGEAIIDAYFAYAKTYGLRLFTASEPDDPFQSVVHKPEGGMSNVLCIRPVGSKESGWSRVGDAIDWMEESHNYNQKDRVEIYNSDSYQFAGFMNAESGEPLSQRKVYPWICTKNEDNVNPDTLDVLAQDIGFKDHKEASRLVVPVVPLEIRVLAEFGQLFTTDDVWKQLRPMLYVYWS